MQQILTTKHVTRLISMTDLPKGHIYRIRNTTKYYNICHKYTLKQFANIMRNLNTINSNCKYYFLLLYLSTLVDDGQRPVMEKRSCLTKEYEVKQWRHCLTIDVYERGAFLSLQIFSDSNKKKHFFTTVKESIISTIFLSQTVIFPLVRCKKPI